MLRFYFEVARIAFRRQLIYRWANLAGLCTNIFFASIFSYVIIALYHTRPSVAGYNVRDTLHYTWMMQAIIMTILPFGWIDLMQTIRTGDVVGDLSKPYDFYWYWFSREMGSNAYYILFRGIPTYLAGMILFGLDIPQSWQPWAIFCLTLPAGAIMGIAYRVLYNIVAFWIIEARAMITLALVIAQFLTGSYIPLPLLPSWLRNIINWLPFHNFMDLPVEILLGKVASNTLWFECIRQMIWLLLLTFLVKKITNIARQRVIAQGG